MTAKLVFSETDKEQVYYVGKHGNDSDDGLTINRAFLTFGAAIAAATAAVPGAANRFAIYCEDDGIYTEAITVPQYVDVYAPNAKITSAAGSGIGTGTVLIAANCTVTFREIEQTSATVLSAAVFRTNTSGTGKVIAETINLTNQVIGLFNGSLTGGVLIAEVEQILVDTGWGVGDGATAQGHTHIDIEDIYIRGNNGTGISRFGSGTTVGRVAHILEDGSPTTTLGMFCSAGSLDLFIGNIATDTAWNIAAGGTLHLFINTVSGTRTEVGTVLVNEAGYIRETGGPTNLTPAAIADTQLLQRSGTTIASIAPASLTGMDHGNLNAASLLDDDHTQYLLLAGRAGGQTAIGGTLTTQALTLQDNVVDAKQIIWSNELLNAKAGDFETRHIAVGGGVQPHTAQHMIIGDDTFTGTGNGCIGIGMFPRYTPSASAANTGYALQGNLWFGGTNWGVGSTVTCLWFTPANLFPGAFGSANLDIIGINVGPFINILGQVITSNSMTGLYVAGIGGLFGNDSSISNIVRGVWINDSPIAGAFRSWGRQTGLQIDGQTQGTIKQGIWLNGDGIGADIAFGAGVAGAADAAIYYNGTNLIIDPNLLGTGKVYIGATANDTLRLTTLEFGADVSLTRGAADRLDLATGDSLRIVSGQLQLGTDVVLSRGAANRLDLASGDSLKLNGTGQVDHAVNDALGGGAAATLGTIGGTGPTVAGQSKWIRVKVAGVDHWVPAWL